MYVTRFFFDFFWVSDFSLFQLANATAFSIALPTIQKEMHLKEAQLQWIVSVYPLSSVSFCSSSCHVM